MGPRRGMRMGLGGEHEARCPVVCRAGVTDESLSPSQALCHTLPVRALSRFVGRLRVVLLPQRHVEFSRVCTKRQAPYFLTTFSVNSPKESNPRDDEIREARRTA